MKCETSGDAMEIIALLLDGDFRIEFDQIKGAVYGKVFKYDVEEPILDEVGGSLFEVIKKFNAKWSQLHVES